MNYTSLVSPLVIRYECGMYKLLFVCTGNICRSPTAEGVLRHHATAAGLADKLFIDSAGTIDYHVGEAPDHRSVTAAKKRGIDLSGLRARQVLPKDFVDFDLILALDQGHLTILQQMAPKNASSHAELFLKYAGDPYKIEVPDPYYGSTADFEKVLDLIDEGSRLLLTKIQPQLV